MNEPTNQFKELIGRQVVLDTTSPYVYLGTLSEGDHHFFALENADVHDLRDTNTTRELYVFQAQQHGIRANRRRVLVRRDEVVSVSLLEDVLH